VASQSIVTGQKAIELDFLPDTPDTLLGGPARRDLRRWPTASARLIDQVANLPLRDTVADMRQAIQAWRRRWRRCRRQLDSAQGVLGGAARQLELTAVESRKTLAAATKPSGRCRQLAGHAESDHAAGRQLPATVLAASRNCSAPWSAPARRRRPPSWHGPAGRHGGTRSPLRGDLDAALRDLSQAARSLRSLSEQARGAAERHHLRESHANDCTDTMAAWPLHAALAACWRPVPRRLHPCC
jgi:paraquat-inducible protein B